MKAIGFIIIAVAFITLSGIANSALLWDQGYDTYQGNYAGYAGAMFLGMSVLEEYNAKADDFILDGSNGTTISKVTIYAIDNTETDGVANNNQPVRASVAFLRNDALYPGSGEDVNRPENGQISTGAARPTDWAPAGKTSAEIAQWFPFEATAGAGGYAGGGGTSWIYEAIVQPDGRGMTITDTGYSVGNDYKIWQLDITLPTPLTLDAGTRYWLAWATSSQANWLAGDPGNNGQLWCTPVKNNPTLAGGWEGNVNNRLWGGGYDFYFKLEGEQIPEPATLSLLLAGFIWNSVIS